MMENEQIYFRKEDIPLDRYYPVIWLASWYPSKTYPTNGDFIQRHAACVDMPLLIIHTIHVPDNNVALNYLLRKEGKRMEVIIQFRRENEGEQIFQKLLYHQRFQKHTKDLLGYLINRQGKPALFHVHVPMKMGPIARWAKQKWNIPYIVSEQSSKYVGDGPDHFDRRSARHRNTVTRVFQEAAIVTNVSATVGSILQKRFQLHTVETIHNVADASLFFPGTKKNTSQTFHFLHASTLTPQKNIEGIIRVMEKLYLIRQDFSLTLLGGEANALDRWRTQKPWLNHIPNVPHEKVAEHMRAADALLMFSRDENFPCVIVEALCCGLVVITSDAGGSGEAIHKANGLVVPVGNEDALADAIQEVMNKRKSYDPHVIRQDAISKYSYPVIGQQFRDLYRKSGVSVV